MRALIFLLATIVAANCISIDCEFKQDFIHDWKIRYTCRTKKFLVVDDDRVVKTVTGEHLRNITIEMKSDNVTQFFARGLNIERFPGGLPSHFANLEVIRITSCNLRLVLKEDLAHLDKLKFLDLVGNKMEKLESDTFENTRALQEVILNNNRLHFVGSKLLEPLQQLKSVSFGGNFCATGYAKDSSEQLARLKTEIKLKCSDISMSDVMDRFDKLEAKFEQLMLRIDENE